MKEEIMTKRTIDKENSEIVIEVSVPSAEWKSAQEKAFNELLKTVKIDGFRPGSKSPAFREQASRRISSQVKWEKAINEKFLNKYLQIANEKIDPSKDTILDSPNYTISKISDEQLEIKFLYPIYPEMEKFNYTGLKLKLGHLTPDKKDLEEAMQEFTRRHAKWDSTTEKANEGDEMVFDFVGSIDGVEFDGGSAEDHSLKIGGKTFIPGFEEQLVGLKTGDKKDIKVSFPTDYYVSEYAGKEAVFAINVKDVKKPGTVELNKEFFDKISLKDVTDEKSLKEYLKKNLESEIADKAIEKFRAEAFKEIKKGSEILYPRALVLREMSAINKRFEDTLKQQGLTRAEYLEYLKSSEEKLTEQIRDEAKNSLTDQLIYVEISRREKINAEQKDYDAHYKKLAATYKMSLETVTGALTKEQLQATIVNSLVADKLIELNDKKGFEELTKYREEQSKKYDEILKSLEAEKPKTEKDSENKEKPKKSTTAKKTAKK
ncbi:trigger factor [Mycoplasmopsis agassizii]|uniref:Trigger factor n=2 Tax=Mycoplasmopsis agassizii TaxID=33922 RepID=A0ABX4H4B9_9BACT|nr:trigger factor [Mycoplasmopsis agassizii]